MLPYTAWRYFYPPRTPAKMRMKPSSLIYKMWMKFPDAIGQYKENGNRNLCVVHPDRSIKFWTRHREPETLDGEPVPQTYKIPEWMKEVILGIAPAGHFTIFDSELVESRTKTVKDVLYLFDTLVWESNHLVGETYRARFGILQNKLGERFMPLDNNPPPGVYIPQNFTAKEWKDRWDAIQTIDHCEGLVLKRQDSILEADPKLLNNSGFMLRIKKPTKNSQF